MKTGTSLTVALAALLAAPAALGQLVTSTPAGVAVAHDGVVELFDGGRSRWTADGVEQATAIAADERRVVVLDAMANAAVVVDLGTGRATRVATAETPVAAAFAGRDVWVLARDARSVQRIGGAEIAVGPDPAFLAAAGGRVYVYSRGAGTIEEIDGDRVARRVAVAPFASDLEIAGHTAFLAFPREAKVRAVDLDEMKSAGEVAVGAVPLDLAIAGGGTALTARILAVADPSAKRVWMTESTQSAWKAFFRGFLRGFIGLGLFGSRSSQFPTGIDRVARAGKQWAAYDSSSGTIYRFTTKKSTALARGVAPGAWTVTPEGIAWWAEGRLHRQ